VKIKPCICTMLAAAALAIRAEPQKGQNEYEQGIRMEEAGRWQEAADAFSAALDAEPTAQAYRHRAKSTADAPFSR